MTILLVSGATATLRGLPLSAPVGHLVTPFTGNDILNIAQSGRCWAADNGCGPKRDGTLPDFDERAWVVMLDGIRGAMDWQGHRSCPGIRSPLWVVVPDRPGDAAETLRMWHYWHHHVRAAKLRMAFVAQDGSEARDYYIPWSKLACLFIGGSTEWKESRHARRLASEAKRRGKAVHVGRVNSERRLRIFDDLGEDANGYALAPDSIDGTQFSMFPDRYIPRWAERLKPGSGGAAGDPGWQGTMFEEGSDGI